MPVCSVSSLPGFLGPLRGFLGPLPAGQLVGCRLSWRVNPCAMQTPARSVSSPRVGPCTARMPVSSVSSLSGFLGPLPCVLQLCAANPGSVTNPGAMGVPHQLPVGCSCRAATVAARFLLQLLCCSPLQPTPAPLPIQGLWECCCNCPSAAIAVLQQLPATFVLQLTAANPCPVTNRYQSRGYGGAAPAARWLQLPCCSSCSPLPVAPFLL